MNAEIFSLAPFDTGCRKQLTHGSFTTSYWEYGQDGGTPLLLIHGFRGDHHGLEFIANALAQKSSARIIVPDLPGFGESYEETERPCDIHFYIDWLASFAQALALDKFHLIGHSFGSIITSHAVSCAALVPATLTLINPICEPPLDGQNRLAAAGAEFYYWLGAHLPERLGQPLLKARIITRVTSEFMAKTKNKTLRRFINHQHDLYFSTFNSRRALMQAYKTSVTHHVAEVAENLHLPVLSIIGSQDDLGSVPAQKKLSHQIPDCQLQIISKVGHLIHYEAPLKATKFILDFVKDNA